MSEFSLSEWESTIRDVLDTDGEFRMYPRGLSMLPFLRQGRDSVSLVRPHFPLKKYDMPFYQRDDGHYVLHRVVRVDPDGTYRLLGDHQILEERGVREEQIIAVVSRVFRNGKEISLTSFGYRFYLWLWQCRFLRRVFFKSIRIFRPQYFR